MNHEKKKKNILSFNHKRMYLKLIIFLFCLNILILCVVDATETNKDNNDINLGNDVNLEEIEANVLDEDFPIDNEEDIIVTDEELYQEVIDECLKAKDYINKKDIETAINIYQKCISKEYIYDEVKNPCYEQLADIYLFDGGNTYRNLTKSYELYKYAANTYGSSHSQHILSFLYSIGLGVNKNIPLSITFDYFASIGDDSNAHMTLGYRHLYGYGVPKSCDTSAAYYTKAAQAVLELIDNDPTLTIEKLRLSKEKNRKKSKDRETDVVNYYNLAAELGDVEAQVTLGQLNFYGAHGLDQNIQAAEQFFRKAAAQGNTESMAKLGQMYLNGIGVEQNNQTALEWYKKAAAQGDSNAQNGLGVIYLNGHGITADSSLALKYFKKAASQNNPDAQFNLGTLYYTGNGVSKKYDTALQYFSMAANNGHTKALFNMGIMHLQGLGTVKSCSAGTNILKNVAERGLSAVYISNAHQSYLNHEMDSSFILYALAAFQGDEIAQSNTAWILDYEQDQITIFDQHIIDNTIQYEPTYIGITKQQQQQVPLQQQQQSEEQQKSEEEPSDSLDQLNSQKKIRELALYHYDLSSKQGNIDAYRRMGDYAYYGFGYPSDYKHAAELYQKASDAHNSQSLFNLAYMYEFGIGLPQDLHLAKRFYDLSYTVNPKAFAPVKLAILRLKIHQYWLQWQKTRQNDQQATISDDQAALDKAALDKAATTDHDHTKSWWNILSNQINQFNHIELYKVYLLYENTILIGLCLLGGLLVYLRADIYNEADQ